MKKISLLLFFISTLCHAQIINIPDANFKNKLLGANTTNGNACIVSSFVIVLSDASVRFYFDSN